MSEQPADISVIIPSFERTEMALESVDSVLRQSCPVSEIILVAGGSDQHADFWRKRASGKLRVIRERKPGQQAARNAGIHAATSTWIATLDDDDLYELNFIESIVPVIADGRADIVAADHRKFRPGRADRRTNFEAAPRGYWKGLRPSDPSAAWSFIGKFPLERLLTRIPVYPSTTVMRRDFALAIGGFDTRMFGIPSEDIEFLVRALTYGNLSLVWSPLVRYRVHESNFSRDAIARAIGRWRIFEFVREAHTELPQSFREALDRDLPRRRRRMLKLAYSLRDTALADEVWSKLEPLQRTPDVFAIRLVGRTFGQWYGNARTPVRTDNA